MGELALAGVAGAVIVLALILWLKRIHDPKALAGRLAITAVLFAIMYFMAFPGMAAGGYAAVGGLLFTLAIGWLLAIVWASAISGSVGRLFGNLYDGGDLEVVPKPFFSVFQGQRRKGKYFAALAEIRRQLDKFPKDFEGQMLLAELQAENLNDLPGAAITIHRLCGQPEHAPANLASALNRLADWHLDLTKDREAAQQALEKIMELFPDTELASRAAQRIGHLAATEMLLAPHDRERLAVKKGVQNLGLRRGTDGRLKAPEVDQEKVAADYVAHLEQHPLDTHARENLAVIYAQHYHRLDLARDQLEQLIQQPNHAAKQVAHWLNRLADLEVQEGAELSQVQATVQRIIDLYPDAAAAAGAQRRLDRLKLELKAKEKGRDVPLGIYEQNLGLKRKG